MGLRDLKHPEPPKQEELPLRNLEQLFPSRAAGPSPIAEHYIGKIRELLKLPVQRNPAADLWDTLFWPRDRLFMLRMAELPAELNRRTWYQLEPEEQARIVATFCKLRDWVNRFPPPIAPPEGGR